MVRSRVLRIMTAELIHIRRYVDLQLALHVVALRVSSVLASLSLHEVACCVQHQCTYFLTRQLVHLDVRHTRSASHLNAAIDQLENASVEDIERCRQLSRSWVQDHVAKLEYGTLLLRDRPRPMSDKVS